MIRRALFRNFNIIYRFSQWTRKRFTPAGQLVLGGLVFSGIFGIDTRQTMSFQVFSLLLALLILAVLSCLVFRGRFTVKRHLPEYATAGIPVKYQMTLTNLTNKKQSSLKIIDALDNPLPEFADFMASARDDRSRNWFDRMVGYPRWLLLMQKKRGGIIRPLFIEEIIAGNSMKYDIELKPLRRGYIKFAHSTLLRPDPANIFYSAKTIDNKDKLLILPKRYKLPHFSLPGKRKYQRGGINYAGSVGDSEEFISLRDYRPGDPLRKIHWRSLAKTNKPVVKEYQDEYFMRTALMLDTFTGNIPGKIFEEAVSVAASIISQPIKQDSLLDLMFIGAESYLVSAGRNIGNIQRSLEILACVEPCNDKPFRYLSTLVIKNINRLSSLICILINWDNDRQQLLEKIEKTDIPFFAFLIVESKNDVPDTVHHFINNKKLLPLQYDSIEDDIKNITACMQ